MRVVISIALISAIMALVTFGFLQFSKNDAEATLELGLDELEVSCFSLLKNGAPRDLDDPSSTMGSMRTITLDIPEKTMFVGIGCDPSTTGDTLIADGSVFFSQISNAGKTVRWLDPAMRFRRGTEDSDGKWMMTESGVELYDAGETILNIELVEQDTLLYLLIHHH